LNGSIGINIKFNFMNDKNNATGMNRVLHFDLYADDPERISDFYGKTFGWKFEKWEGDVGMDYWMIMTGPEGAPGINGGMSRRGKESAKRASVGAITIAVDDIDGVIGKVKKFGGEIVMDKTVLPGVGWLASFRDTEGNELSLMQTDMSLK
jgi:uncharacterized protein